MLGVLDQPVVLGMEDSVNRGQADVLVHATVAGHVVRVQKLVVVGARLERIDIELNVVNQYLVAAGSGVSNFDPQPLAIMDGIDRSGVESDRGPLSVTGDRQRGCCQHNVIGRHKPCRATDETLVQAIADLKR